MGPEFEDRKGVGEPLGQKRREVPATPHIANPSTITRATPTNFRLESIHAQVGTGPRWECHITADQVQWVEARGLKKA